MFLVIVETKIVWYQSFSQNEVIHVLKFYLAKHLIDAYLYYTTLSSLFRFVELTDLLNKQLKQKQTWQFIEDHDTCSYIHRETLANDKRNESYF